MTDIFIPFETWKMKRPVYLVDFKLLVNEKTWYFMMAKVFMNAKVFLRQKFS